MRGKPLADRIRAEVAEEVKAVGSVGIVTVLVGEDPASQVYIRLKQKAATVAGMESTYLRLPADISDDYLLALVASLVRRQPDEPRIVQLPLPPQHYAARIMHRDDP